MSWLWDRSRIRGRTPAEQLEAIDVGLDRLQRELTTPEPLYTLPNPGIGLSVTPNMGKGVVRAFFWAVTHGGAWSIANPTGLQAGAIVVLTWWNNSAGGILAPSLGSTFGFAPNVPALPSAGSSASMTFVALTPTLLYQVACEPVTGGTGSGETNTGSNQNAAGVGVFDTKAGVDLQFRGIDVPSGKLQVALNAVNKTLEMTIAPLGVDKTELAANAVDFTKFRTLPVDNVVGRQTAGTGNAELIACTAAGRALIAGADVAAQRATLGFAVGKADADQATFVNAQTAITNLSFPIGASEIWIADFVVSVTMGTAATGVKFYFTFPASCTGEIHYEGNVATLATWQSLYQAVLTVPGTFFVTGIVTGTVKLRAVIRNSTTAGTIQLVGVTGGATTTCAVKKGSSFTARRQTA